MEAFKITKDIILITCVFYLKKENNYTDGGDYSLYQKWSDEHNCLWSHSYSPNALFLIFISSHCLMKIKLENKEAQLLKHK